MPSFLPESGLLPALYLGTLGAALAGIVWSHGGGTRTGVAAIDAGPFVTATLDAVVWRHLTHYFFPFELRPPGAVAPFFFSQGGRPLAFLLRGSAVPAGLTYSFLGFLSPFLRFFNRNHLYSWYWDNGLLT